MPSKEIDELIRQAKSRLKLELLNININKDNILPNRELAKLLHISAS